MRSSPHALVIALLLNVTNIVPSAIADESYYDIPVPGRLVDLGGYKLHLNCRGSGSPVVILDAGLGDWSTHWTGVQHLLEGDTRVCSYDRAGYGWSDPGPRPRDSLSIVTELHSLLGKAGVEPPYVLVGHSFGGLNMRLFAGMFAVEVAGLVLVEASHPESLPYRRNEQGTSLSAMPYAGSQLMVIHPVEIDESKFPPEAQPAIHDNLLQTKSLATSRGEYRALAYSVSELLQAPPIGDIPLTVITRGRREWPAGEVGDVREASWRGQQIELTRLSKLGSQIIATGSGHHVHLDEPDIVADAVRDMVMAARATLNFAVKNK